MSPFCLLDSYFLQKKMKMSQNITKCLDVFSFFLKDHQQKQHKNEQKQPQVVEILPSFSDYEIEIIQDSFNFIKKYRDEIAVASLNR